MVKGASLRYFRGLSETFLKPGLLLSTMNEEKDRQILLIVVNGSAHLMELLGSLIQSCHQGTSSSGSNTLVPLEKKVKRLIE